MKKMLLVLIFAVVSQESLALNSGVRKPANAEDCKSSLAECTAELVKSSQSDKFVQAILKAESTRLPSNWKCEPISDWKINQGSAIAETTITCHGTDQHLMLDFSGEIERSAKNIWVVRVNSVKERFGD